MNKVYFSVILFLISSVCFTQTKTVIDDSFDKNNGGWSENPKGDEFQTKVDDGYYILKVKDKTSSYWSHIKTEFNGDEENFEIEANLECVAGEEDRGFGLLLGMYSDNNNYKLFYITNNGYFKITHFYSNETHNIKDWTKTSAIKLKAENKLRVKRDYNCARFYINDELVFTNCEMTWWGSKFGFIVGQEQKVKVNHVKMTTTPKKIPLVENSIQGRKKESLGDLVNSKYDELAPLISYDGKTLYFTRSNHPDNIGGDNNQDIWYTTIDENGNWTAAKNIGTPLNNNGANSIKSMSPDQNTCIVSNLYNADGTSNGQGLSTASKGMNGWKVPTKITIQNLVNVNTYVDYFLTADNKTLLMAIEDKNSYGDMDLCVSFLQPDGSFSEPRNLGPIINTPGAEFGMSLAADGKTMYFNSYGHECYGSSDVFMTKRLDDTWTNWSRPLNLGPEINSENWEGVFCIPANGEYAYLSTQDNSIGLADICRIRLTKEEKPEPVVLIYGKVLNKKTNEPIGAKITYHDLKDNKEIGIANSAEKDGSYKIILPLGKAYSFLAEKNSFYSVSDYMDVTTLSEYKEIERNLYLAPLEQGTTILLNNIFFEFDKSDLKPESYSELDRLLKILNDNPNLNIEIAGHTDDKGSDEYNKNLSQSRVNSVVKYLTQKGISSSRLTPVGYGESQPLVENSSDENRAKNRRVEFTILKN